MLTYHLIPENENIKLEVILKKISDYLTSFVGDIKAEYKESGNKSDNLLVISYTNASFTSEFKIEEGKVILSVYEDDSITVNLIKNITSNSGFRIFSSKGYFLPNDPKLLEIASVGINDNLYKIFKKTGLTPLFQYQNTLIFFCLDKNKKVVITNRHYLEYLIAGNFEKIESSELTKVVSKNVGEFIALTDRGLINLSFQSFNIDKLPKDCLLQVTNFKLDNDKQRFIQTQTTEKIVDKNYLHLKIGQDYTYNIIEGKLVKLINIFVFYQ